MLKLCFLLSVAVMQQASRACDGNIDQQEQLTVARHRLSDEFFVNSYGIAPNPEIFHFTSQSSARVPEFYINPYEGRTPFTKPRIQPFTKQFVINSGNEENSQESEGRFALRGLGANLINTGLFNNRFTPANTWRPFQNLVNRIPLSYNPNFNSIISSFDACTAPSGDAGICAPGNICSLFGGRPSGPCILGKVCCINAITTCGGTVTLNNTYWQSPSTAVSAPSTCALTVRMDTKLVEQLAKPICQIRLDFVSFTTAQPILGTCTDTFVVGGSTSLAPIICGDNTGQHMYLDVLSSANTPTDVQLLFNFASGSVARSWNIKIVLLPCGASYLAPSECLQYFTATSGRVKSFNWKDVGGTAIRQLNNQNYNICFRTELVSSQKATQMCLSVCAVTNGGDAFSITTPTSTGAAEAADAVVLVEKTLVPLKKILSDKETELVDKEKDLKMKDAALADAVKAVEEAISPEAIAAAEAEVTAATTAQTAAKDAVDIAKGAVTAAQTAVTTTQSALTAAQTALTEAANIAAPLSGVGISASINGVDTATCLYDFLLIAGARDSSTNAEADRFCGNALNPAITPVGTSVQVCSLIKPFRIAYKTDNTEGKVTAGTDILPSPADTANAGFCLDFQEK